MLIKYNYIFILIIVTIAFKFNTLNTYFSSQSPLLVKAFYVYVHVFYIYVNAFNVYMKAFYVYACILSILCTCA